MLTHQIWNKVCVTVSRCTALSNRIIGKASPISSFLQKTTNNDVSCCRAYCSSYDLDPDSPYKGTGPQYRYERHNLKLFDGGVLPRPEQYKNSPVKGLPRWRRGAKDVWKQKKALFGQNDYIDILGDGSIHPRDLLNGPAWIRGFTGSEYRRTLRRLEFEGEYLKHVRPKEYHDLKKRVWFLYKKKVTRRKKAPFWSRRGHTYKSFTDKFNKSWEY